MLHGVKYFNNDAFYLMKKHDCPECGAKLEKVKVSRIVNSKSPEAEKFDSVSADHVLPPSVLSLMRILRMRPLFRIRATSLSFFFKRVVSPQ